MIHTEEQLVSLLDDALRADSENINVEFKDCRDGMYKDIWKPYTAFSNSPGGGVIFFGIHENKLTRVKTVVGGLRIDELQQNIIAYLEQKLINKADYDLKVITYQDKQLLCLSICETPQELKPCFYDDLGIDKGACVRVGNSNRQISEAELRSFLSYSPAYNFDRKIVFGTSLEDIDTEKVKTFLKKSAERRRRTYDDTLEETVLKNIGIVAQYEDQIEPTVAGMMIFSKKQPQDYDDLSRYMVRCVRYRGNSASTPILDQLDVFGTLDTQVDTVLNFIERNVKTEAKIVRSKREERLEYPFLALREAIVNALVHRDYSNKGTYVQVTIYGNRIEITNAGTLPPGVTIENLKNAQFSRNNVIAQVMRDLDYMEEFGRGIDLIYSQMSEWTLPEPLFKNVSNVFKVILLGKDFPNLNERQVKFWDYLQDKSQMTALVAHSLFPSVSRQTINADLKRMQDMELIELKGSANNTYYIPRY